MFPNKADAVEALGLGPAADALGDFLSSLLELALEGGLGEGEALEPLGEFADLESFEDELLLLPMASMPGMLKGFDIPGMP